jgi:hypothetical protein
MAIVLEFISFCNSMLCCLLLYFSKWILIVRVLGSPLLPVLVEKIIIKMVGDENPNNGQQFDSPSQHIDPK